LSQADRISKLNGLVGGICDEWLSEGWLYAEDIESRSV
jgi:hypothetical protein